MNKQSIAAAVISLILGLVIGGAIVQVQLMNKALENHSVRISQMEGTLLQIVNLINGRSQGQPQPQGAPAEKERLP